MQVGQNVFEAGAPPRTPLGEVTARPVERGGKRGEFARAPRRLGAPPSLKNTENGVPGGFFLT